MTPRATSVVALAGLVPAATVGAALISLGGRDLHVRIVTNTGSGTSTQNSTAQSWDAAISTGTPQQGSNGPVSAYATFTQTTSTGATTQDLSLRFHGTITHFRGSSGVNNRATECSSSQWVTFSVATQVTYALTALGATAMTGPASASTAFGVEQLGVAPPILASTQASSTGTLWTATLAAGTYRFWSQTTIAGLPAAGDGTSNATGSWSFHADSVPSPGPLALVAVAVLPGRRRRGTLAVH